MQWADTVSSSQFTSISYSPRTLPQSRQYSISLLPSLIPSVGPLISSLVASGVARYGGFRLLERVGVYDPSGIVRNVPGSKEDVFKSTDITLLDKRRLMRFLLFAAGDFETKSELAGKEDMPFPEFLKSAFSLNEDAVTAVTYSLAYCASATGKSGFFRKSYTTKQFVDPSLPALRRVQRYLRSAGRYGPSSFLIGHYGGAGEIAQGFCRTAAVSGGVYILGRPISSITPYEDVAPEDRPTHSDDPSAFPKYIIKLDEFPDPLTSDLIISAQGYIPSNLLHTTKLVAPSHLYESTPFVTPIARCIAIIDQPLSLSPATLTPDPTSDLEDQSSDPRSLLSTSNLDTAVLVFPPSSLPTGGSATASATVLMTGEGSMSTPSGKCKRLTLLLPISFLQKCRDTIHIDTTP